MITLDDLAKMRTIKILTESQDILAKLNGRASVTIKKVSLRLAQSRIGPHILIDFERDHGDGRAYARKAKIFLDDYRLQYSRTQLLARLSACRTLEDIRALSDVNPNFSVLF